MEWINWVFVGMFLVLTIIMGYLAYLTTRKDYMPIIPPTVKRRTPEVKRIAQRIRVMNVILLSAGALMSLFLAVSPLFFQGEFQTLNGGLFKLLMAAALLDLFYGIWGRRKMESLGR